MSRPAKHWCVCSDLSGVVRISTPDGGFATEQEALERLVELLKTERDEIVAKLGRARFRLTMHRKANK